MKAFFLTGSAALLLACGAIVSPVMAGGKIVNLTLRVLVDGPPPCSVKGSAVEFGNVIHIAHRTCGPDTIWQAANL